MNTNKLDRISPNAKLHHDETFSAICPLSEAQRAVYLDCLEEPGSDSYIVIYDNMLTGDIDVKRFMECIKRSVADHPVFTPDMVDVRYMETDDIASETDNLFTTNILYRIGFSWPLVEDAYLERAIASLKSLGFFDR